MDLLLCTIFLIALNHLHKASGFVIYNPKNPIRRESLQGKVQSELQQQSSAQTNRRAHLNGNENQDKNYHFLGPGEIPLGQVKDLESFLLGAQFGQKFNRHSLGTLENNFENNIERQNARNLISTTNTPDPNPWKTARVIPYTGPRAPMPPSGTLKVVPYPLTTTPPPTKRNPILILETSISSSLSPSNTSTQSHGIQSKVSSTQNPDLSDSFEYYDQFDTLSPIQSGNIDSLPFLPKLANVSNLTLSQIDMGNMTLMDFIAWEQEVAAGAGESLQVLPELAFNVSVPPVTVIVDQTPFHVSGDANWNESLVGLSSNSNISIVPIVINPGTNQTELSQPLNLEAKNVTSKLNSTTLANNSSYTTPLLGNVTQQSN